MARLKAESLTQRALREAPGSPREAESRRSAAGRGQRLLGKGLRGKGTDRASNGGHFEEKVKWIEERGKKRGEEEGLRRGERGRSSYGWFPGGVGDKRNRAKTRDKPRSSRVCILRAATLDSSV